MTFGVSGKNGKREVNKTNNRKAKMKKKTLNKVQTFRASKDALGILTSCMNAGFRKTDMVNDLIMKGGKKWIKDRGDLGA